MKKEPKEATIRKHLIKVGDIVEFYNIKKGKKLDKEEKTNFMVVTKITKKGRKTEIDGPDEAYTIRKALEYYKSDPADLASPIYNFAIKRIIPKNKIKEAMLLQEL